MLCRSFCEPALKVTQDIPLAPCLPPVFVSLVWDVDVMAGVPAAMVKLWGQILGLVVL